MSYRAFGGTVADAAAEAGLPLVASVAQATPRSDLALPIMLGLGIGGGVALLGGLFYIASRSRVRTSRRRRS